MAIYELVRILNALRKITTNLFLNLLSNILKQIYIKNIHLSCTELGMSIDFKIIICCAKRAFFNFSKVIILTPLNPKEEI